jgi:hypothetical protein
LLADLKRNSKFFVQLCCWENLGESAGGTFDS